MSVWQAGRLDPGSLRAPALGRRTGRLALLGHRGSHGDDGPVENTLAAFEAALVEGADAVELDVWRTADGALVIYHDDVLPGARAPIAQMDAAQVRAHRLPRGERVPTLAEALDLMRGRIEVNVELKHGEALVDTLRLLRGLKMTRDVLLSSFVLPAMEEARARAPEVARALIMGTESLHPAVRFREAFPFWHLRRADAVAWHPGWPLVGRPVVEALTRFGVAVNVWTVNDPEMARRLAGWGVAGVFTDHPAELRRALT